MDNLMNFGGLSSLSEYRHKPRRRLITINLFMIRVSMIGLGGQALN